MHNSANYDIHLIIRELAKAEGVLLSLMFYLIEKYWK
jgi:hypothetical protein